MITREQFVEAYMQHLPKRWVRFAFKYFSKSTAEENMRPARTITIILGTMFISGFVSTVANMPRKVRGTITVLYCVILFPVVLFMLAAGLSNNARIGKIRKKLGVSVEEYNRLADLYGYLVPKE